MSKIKKSDLLQLIQEQADMIEQLANRIFLNKQSIIRLENKLESHPKQLNQSVFNNMHERWKFAAVDADGRAHRFNKEVSPHGKGFCYEGCEYSEFKFSLIGTGYDATNWQNSLIERDDIAKKLADVDLSSELTGSDLTRAMLARGDYHVMCAVSDRSESDAILSCNSAVITGGEIRGVFTDSFDGMYEHAVPINNQGEPLTASEVGL